MIEHDVGAHLPCHAQTIRIAIDPDDERGAHQLRSCCRAQSYWPLRKDDDRVSDLDLRGFSATQARRCDISQEHHLLVAQLLRNLCHIRHRMWNQQILRLGSIDLVAETPTAERLITFAVTTLRKMTR